MNYFIFSNRFGVETLKNFLLCVKEDVIVSSMTEGGYWVMMEELDKYPEAVSALGRWDLTMVAPFNISFDNFYYNHWCSGKMFEFCWYFFVIHLIKMYLQLKMRFEWLVKFYFICLLFYLNKCLNLNKTVLSSLMHFF